MGSASSPKTQSKSRRAPRSKSFSGGSTHLPRPPTPLAHDLEAFLAIEPERRLVLAVDEQADAHRALFLHPAHAPAKERAPESEAARPLRRADHRDLAALGIERAA